MPKDENIMEKVVSLCKRRGFIFQSSEIYGGINSCYDYGPLGVELKRNVKELWWHAMTRERNDIEGLDSSILMHPKVWKASGHVDGFTDPMVDCKRCKNRFREDELDTDVCPACGGELTEARMFNLMFKTHMGPVENEAAVVYLRPETAQGIYVNFLNVQGTSRRKIPFGIAQIGKAFRNEITPGNFIFRTREFEQMEMQFFVHPSEDAQWLEHWKEQRFEWYLKLGLHKEKLRFHRHGKDELAHYAKEAYDIEYEFPIGWKELEGIHNRTDYDLLGHQAGSSKRLTYFDEARQERYLPYIIETSAGCDRTILTALVDAYDEEEERTVMRLHPTLAPLKVAVLPLVKKDGMPEIARKIYNDLRNKWRATYDEVSAIGRRYRRQDEIGTPFAVTIDSETLQDGSVTLRYRDSMAQERYPAERIKDILAEKLSIE
ncbi:glycine--tRNA ligase [candidate division KSB1 bacterium]